MSSNDIVLLSATQLRDKIRLKQLSSEEVLVAHLEQIDRFNPKLNAIVTLCPDLGLQAARQIDKSISRNEHIGPLAGLPVAHKDLVMTRGIRTTYGSPIFSNFIPAQDALIVERLKLAGAVTIGKTNTPEFGAGSQTFNTVFGETVNPYDITKTCGGSSGGAAVALASRMVPIADGSDTGGSLRNPASFCNIVGFRPSPGRVPIYPSKISWSPISVQGPMARTVADCALMLSAISGPDSRVPLSISEPGQHFLRPLERNFKGVRIAWSQHLGDLPIDYRIIDVIANSIQHFESIGCDVEEATPDLSFADEIFKIWRGWGREINEGKLLRENKNQLKDTMIWDIEQGVHLSGSDVGWAESERTALFLRMHAFMEKYEFLICPVTQVPPFDVRQRFVSEINGIKMGSFIDWMKSCYYITVTGHPSISVPCGFTTEGLPVGVQIIGRYRADFAVLQLANAFEKATGCWEKLPSLLAP